jgi:DNA-binding CsgD family transcriptional regulator
MSIDIVQLISTNADRSKVWFSVPGFQMVVDRLIARFALSRAQTRVFLPLVLAYEDLQIAAILFISRETVRSHVKAILNAVGTSNRKDITRAFLFELARLSPTT